MTAALAAFAAVPGLVCGSFLNVVAARVPHGRSVVRPGSSCPSCGSAVAWYDNVPLLSYLLLRGRCRSCSARIGATYPLVELTTALLVAGCVLAFGLTLDALLASFFCTILVVLSVIDLEHRIIPNRIVLPAAAVVLVAQTALHPSPEWAIAALAGSLFLFVGALAYPKGMGMGDVKLMLLIGAMLGRTVGVGLLVGMFLALVPSLVLLARHGAAARKQAIPFAPFLAGGALVALFAGDQLLRVYLTLF
jgi:leader peptidase (prepilin peptidase)/N-methyltransferase